MGSLPLAAWLVYSPGMRTFCPTLAAVLFAAASPLLAQQGAASFKNFRGTPAGQYQQKSQAFHDGQPFGQPVDDTRCAGSLTAAQASAIKSMGNAAAPACTIRILSDTATTAEYEQTCNPGPMQQVIHHTMRVVDERTFSEDTRMSTGGRDMIETRSTVKYLGACTPQQLAENAAAARDAAAMMNGGTTSGGMKMPAMPKPSAEDCAQVAEMRQQAKEAIAGCASQPAAERAQCTAVMQGMAPRIAQLEAMCK